MLGAGALLFKLCRFAVCFLQNLSGSGGKSGAFLLADGVLRGNQLLNQLKYLFFLCFALCEKLGGGTGLFPKQTQKNVLGSYIILL